MDLFSFSFLWGMREATIGITPASAQDHVVPRIDMGPHACQVTAAGPCDILQTGNRQNPTDLRSGVHFLNLSVVPDKGGRWGGPVSPLMVDDSSSWCHGFSCCYRENYRPSHTPHSALGRN